MARDRIGDVEVTPGIRIIIAPWVLHRHRKLWAEPDLFRPARFAPENRGKISRFAYLPFGAGARICVGMGFAMQEMLLSLVDDLPAFPRHARGGRSGVSVRAHDPAAAQRPADADLAARLALPLRIPQSESRDPEPRNKNWIPLSRE